MVLLQNAKISMPCITEDENVNTKLASDPPELNKRIPQTLSVYDLKNIFAKE